MGEVNFFRVAGKPLKTLTANRDSLLTTDLSKSLKIEIYLMNSIKMKNFFQTLTDNAREHLQELRAQDPSFPL